MDNKWNVRTANGLSSENLKGKPRKCICFCIVIFFLHLAGTRWICYPIPSWTNCVAVVSWEPIRDTIANRCHLSPRKQPRWPCTGYSDNCRPYLCSSFRWTRTAGIEWAQAFAVCWRFLTISRLEDWHVMLANLRQADASVYCCDDLWSHRVGQRLTCDSTRAISERRRRHHHHHVHRCHCCLMISVCKRNTTN